MRRIFQLLAFVCCLVFSVYTFAQDTDLATIQVRSIGVAPYAFSNDSIDRGIYFEVANLLLKRLGYSHRNRVAPYARIIKELQTGQTDLTIMFKYKELDDYVTFLAPIPALKIVVLGLKGHGFKAINDLKGKRLAYLRGAKFNDEIDENSEIIRFDMINFEQGVQMLLLGRVDAIIGPLEPILFASIQLTEKSDLFDAPLVVGERTPWLQVSNKSLKKLPIDKLEKEFRLILDGGEFGKIRQKYVPSSYFE